MRAGFARYRVAIAFTLPTLLVGAAFSPAVVSYPIIPVAAMLVTGAITVLLALPLFLILRGIGWLGWVPVTASGVLCGALVGVGGDGIPMGTMILGAGFAMLMWWAGIFRNPRYPAVSATWPWSMLWLILLAGLWFWYRQAMVGAFAVFH